MGLKVIIAGSRDIGLHAARRAADEAMLKHQSPEMIRRVADQAARLEADKIVTVAMTTFQLAGPRVGGAPQGALPGLEPLPAATAWDAVDEVVSGGARGADAAGEVWARRQGCAVEVFPADWELYGRGAGPRRNGQMADHADALVALWDGVSSGTKDMIRQMRRRMKPVWVFVLPSA